jgi:hypothetical protein
LYYEFEEKNSALPKATDYKIFKIFTVKILSRNLLKTWKFKKIIILMIFLTIRKSI